ncbi:MAG: hypothetical protein E7Z84_03705 [Methanosphaera stadtmanae]|jgi:type II secretory pathway pseudopilin PulG|nr:hypothetical protein [Methanosphaera stadtmanae]
MDNDDQFQKENLSRSSDDKFIVDENYKPDSQINQYNNTEKQSKSSFFTKKKILLIIGIIIILLLIGIIIIATSPMYNEGNVLPNSSNLTLNYNNDLSIYYREEIATGKNLGDLYMNVEEYDGIITLDLSKVNWKDTDTSNIDYAKEYSAEDLKESLKDPNTYNVSITFYDKNNNQLNTTLSGNDIKMDLNGNILTITVKSNRTSDMLLTKNNCENTNSAKLKLSYNYGFNDYVIYSDLTGENLVVNHV